MDWFDICYLLLEFLYKVVRFRYKNNWIRVERSREQQGMDFSIGAPMETVTLSSIGRDKGIYHEMLEEGSWER